MSELEDQEPSRDEGMLEDGGSETDAFDSSSDGKIRAHVDMGFFRRFLFLGLALLGYAGWCYFDATVNYPKKLLIAEAFESFGDGEVEREKWRELANEKGWSTSTPEKTSEEWRGLIGQQYIMLAAAVAGAVFFLGKWALARGSWVEGSSEEIRTSFGRRIELDKVQSINKRKWESKGIAVINYEGVHGPTRFTLDDFKYDRAAMAKIIAFAEAKLPSSEDEEASVEEVEEEEAEA
ncbi:MAG: hypothetical protein AAF664_00940 [Planctomycetota bacterium]